MSPKDSKFLEDTEITGGSEELNSAMISIEAKLTALYFSALIGASLSEIEVCKIGLWGCNPLRGAWIVQYDATPMLVILAFTSMSRKLLAIVSISVGIGLFMLGFQAAHSEGSLTWPVYNFMLLLGGSVGACAIMGFSNLHRERHVHPPPPLAPAAPNDSNQNLRLFSLKEKLLYLCTGALAGHILGQILIYASVIDRSEMPVIFAFIVGGSATPIVILFSQLAMDKAKTIRCSLVVAILVLGLSVVFEQNALGYHSLWFAGMLTALAALTVQKRGLRGQALSSRA